LKVSQGPTRGEGKGQKANRKLQTAKANLLFSFCRLLFALPKARRENDIAFGPKSLYLYSAFGLKGKAWQWARKTSCHVLSLSFL